MRVSAQNIASLGLILLPTHDGPYRFRCCGRAEGAVQCIQREGKDSHYNEHRRNDDALNSTAQNRIRNDGERLVDNHVCQEERYKQQVAILPNGLDLVGIFLLVSKEDSHVIERLVP